MRTYPKTSSLLFRFLSVTLLIFLAMAAVALFAFKGAVDHITGYLGSAYAGKYALANRALLHQPLDREIALARQMADSPVIRGWARNETDPGRRDRALAELESYRRRFAEKSWFFIIEGSRHYYFDDENHRYGDTKLAYTLDPDHQEDAWYFATLKNVPEYALNVNYDGVLDAHKVWINVVMRGPDGRPIGVAGTGIDLSAFLRVAVDNTEAGVENILLDQRLAIQAHRDRDRIEQHSVAKSEEQISGIRRLFPDPEDIRRLQAAFEKLRGGSNSETVFVTLNGRRQIVGAAYLSNLEWYVLTILDPEALIRKHLYPPIFGVGVAFMLLVLIAVGTSVHRIVLAPLVAVTAAAERVSEEDYTVKLSSERKDEIGTLTRAFSEMSARVRDHAENLELRVKERTTQLNETNTRLQEKTEKLEDAMNKVRTLSSLLPICASCKKIRDDKGSWCNIETYILDHTGTKFSHGICPDCSKKLYPGYSNDG
ncbi:MAG: HAMP domain-containing protein [Deltaproteobacteria bacterium]|nr:MAG: HAMP domain-containing protein [Deltaproteobacteria bacterium]